MTGKERVLTALQGKQTDRICWAPLIDQYYTSSLPNQGYNPLSVPDAIRMIGADIIERHVPTIKLEYDDSVRLSVEQGSDYEHTTISTPVGTLTEMRRFSPTGHTWYVAKYLLENCNDVDIYKYVVEHSRFIRDYNSFLEHEQAIGNDGIATSTGKTTPIQAFLQYLCGVENAFYLLAEAPELLEACFHIMHKRNKEAYQLLAEGPAKVIIAYEDTSTTISPTYYELYCSGPIDDYARICHKAGKIYITHMCGKLSAFHQQIKKGLQDGIDSVCPPPTGDTWANEARTLWGPGKCIIGGIDPTILTRMTVPEAATYAKQILDSMTTFQNFILSTGDAVSYGTPVDNLRCVSKIISQYKWR